MSNLNRLSILAVVFVAWACAQAYPLSGGEKDTQAPKVERSSPVNFQPGFNEQKIQLDFDEYVVISSIQTETVISPPLKHEVDYSLRGKQLVITIEDTLLENTTYSINFGEGIVDFTESNPLDSNLFVFSTGSYVDSMELSGILKDAYTMKPVPDALVLLHADLQDSTVRNERPNYFTRTSESGEFSLKYMKPGTYNIFALSDKNSDYLFNLPNERIAFKELPVQLGVDDSLRLRLFREPDTIQYVTTKDVSNWNYANLALNVASTDSLPFRIISDSLSAPLYLESFEQDSFAIWLATEVNDSLELAIIHEQRAIDTIQLRFPDKAAFMKSVEQEKASFELIVKARGGSSHDYFKPFQIETNHPIAAWNFNRAFVVKGKDTLVSDTSNGVTLSDSNKVPHLIQANRLLTYQHEWKKSSAYQLVLLPGAIEDIYGLKNDTVRMNFSTQAYEDYGNLALTINTDSYNGNLIFELLDGNGELVSSRFLRKSRSLAYPLMVPNSYQFRVIYDANGNGTWDAGNYAEHNQPERVVYYDEPVQVRANWDLELDWTIPSEW